MVVCSVMPPDGPITREPMPSLGCIKHYPHDTTGFEQYKNHTRYLLNINRNNKQHNGCE